MPLQIRRGTEAERQTLASPLVSGELLWITDDEKLYIGNGSTLAKDLTPVTGYGDADARDAAASIFTAGTHSGISFTYNGATAIDATVSYPALLQNLSLNNFAINGTGNIDISGTVTATAFRGDYKGSISADDSTILLDALNGSINLDGTVKGDIVPDIADVRVIGDPSDRFAAIYLKADGLHLGSANITSTGAVVNLPAGSLVGGVPIGTSELVSGTNHNINIVGDDSSMIVDSSASTVTATNGFFGNLLGNTTGDHVGTVFGNVTGNVVGNVTGNVAGNVTGNVVGNVTGDLTGNVTGNLTGDIKGSVFGDDSSIIVDAVDNSLFCNDITISGEIVVTNPTIDIVNSDPTQNSKIRRFVPEGGNHTDVFAVTEGSYASGSNLYLSRGTLTSPATVIVSDVLNSDISFAHDGSDFTITTAILTAVDPYGTVSAGAVPGAILLSTYADGNPANGKGVGIDSRGYVGINVGSSQPAATLDINGFAKLAVLTAEPASPANGMIAVADGSTWDPAGTGKSVMVVYLGGGWRVAATAP